MNAVSPAGVDPRLFAAMAKGPKPADIERFLSQTGLFDAKWYSYSYPEQASTPETALQHYLDVGLGHGRGPNEVIDQLGAKPCEGDLARWLPNDSTLQAEMELIRATDLFDD